MEKSLTSDAVAESLGNKVLLEASINIRASDYRFEDKKKIYSGEVSRSRKKAKSDIAEINEIIKMNGFDEGNIATRNKDILDKFFAWLRHEHLT